jgi:glutaminyl-peptide cyclotransferase
MGDRIGRQGALAIALVLVLLTGLAVVVLASAGAPPGTRVPTRTTRQFDVATAYRLTRLQLSFGPRPAGSPSERRAADRLVRLLPSGHFEPVEGGLRNIVGGIPGREPAIVLAAHYDTTPVPAYLGANNSATGVGAVIAIARELARRPRRPGQRAVQFLLTDGEEAPANFHDFYSEGLRGSKAYVAAHRATTKEVIVLDFIALRDETLPRESGSNARLWGGLRTAARHAGVGAMFPAADAAGVLDDHTPFVRAGIPGIDLIDFDYPCWQKRCDTLRQVSRRSLADVGESVLTLVTAERDRP